MDVDIIRTRPVSHIPPAGHLLPDAPLKKYFSRNFPHFATQAMGIIIALLFISPSLAWSETEEKGGVTTTLTAQKISKNQDGTERRDPADSVIPGDTLEYQATYKNSGKSSVQNLVGQMPIPEGMTYIADTGDPKPLYASVDGLHFGIVPLTKIVKQPDGQEKRVPVPYTEYRLLQWELGNLAGGASKTVKARARLNTREEENKKEEQVR